MTTQFMRNYIDLINEMQQPQPQQLDEGMLDFLKQKAMKLISQVNQSSKVKPYIDLVKQQPGIQDQMMDILKSSKSADDVVAQLKQIHWIILGLKPIEGLRRTSIEIEIGT